MSPSIKIDIHFAPGTCGHRIIRRGRRPKHARITRLPHITRLMALAIKYDRMISRSTVERHCEIAELAGTSRSLISDIVRLRLLSPDIQEWLLNLPEQERDDGPLSRAQLRELTRISSWEQQRIQLHRIVPDLFALSASEAPALPTAHKPKPETKGK